MVNCLTGIYCTTSISFPTDEESQKTLKTFKEICSREKWDFSHGIWEAIKEYTTRHGPGNPQQLLLRFVEGKGMYHAPKGKCDLKGCPNPAVGRAVFKKTGAPYNLCRAHKENALASGGWMED